MITLSGTRCDPMNTAYEYSVIIKCISIMKIPVLNSSKSYIDLTIEWIEQLYNNCDGTYRVSERRNTIDEDGTYAITMQMLENTANLKDKNKIVDEYIRCQISAQMHDEIYIQRTPNTEYDEFGDFPADIFQIITRMRILKILNPWLNRFKDDLTLTVTIELPYPRELEGRNKKEIIFIADEKGDDESYFENPYELIKLR